MKTSIYRSLILLAFSLLLMTCGERISEEEKAREKAMMKIEETNEAIDEYLTVLENKYSDLLEGRIIDLEKALDKLRYDLKAYTKSDKVEEKVKVLEGHKRLLQKKIADMKNSCTNGCDDFNLRIDSLFKELDAHVILLDSLLTNV